MSEEELISGEEENTITLEDEIEIDGRVYTLGEIMEAKQNFDSLNQEVQGLREFKTHTNALMSNDLDSDARLKAARVVLSESGYTPEQIENYVNEYETAMNGEEGDYDYEYEEEDTESYEEESPEIMSDDPRIDEARRMAEESSNQLKQYRMEMLQKEMQRGINSAIDNNRDLGVILGRLNDDDNPEAFNNAKGRLEQQIHDQTLKMLQERRSREGTFSESWVEETARKAADEVVGTYRTVIGDIDSIGRAPETVSGETQLSSTPPVPEPTYKEGMNRGDVDSAVTNWTTDALSRLAEESSAGEETKA